MDAFPSINASRADCDRIAEPFQLDVLADPWKVPGPPSAFTVKWPPFDALLNCNMLHLAPEACVEALFKGAAAVIRPQGFMAVYGTCAMRCFWVVVVVAARVGYCGCTSGALVGKVRSWVGAACDPHACWWLTSCRSLHGRREAHHGEQRQV